MQKVSPRSTLERDITESPEVLMKGLSVERCKFFEPVFRIAVDRIAFRDVPKINDAHRTSTLLFRKRRTTIGRVRKVGRELSTGGQGDRQPDKMLADLSVHISACSKPKSVAN